MTPSLSVEVCPTTGHVLVEGEGDCAHQTHLVDAVVRTHASEEPVLDLEGLELDDGVAAALWHDLIRRIRDCYGRVTVVHAPQMLAHTLYKVGDLRSGNVVLRAPRSDEGTTAG